MSCKRVLCSSLHPSEGPPVFTVFNCSPLKARRLSHSLTPPKEEVALFEAPSSSIPNFSDLENGALSDFHPHQVKTRQYDNGNDFSGLMRNSDAPGLKN